MQLVQHGEPVRNPDRLSAEQQHADQVQAQWRAEQAEQYDRADDESHKQLHPEWWRDG